MDCTMSPTLPELAELPNEVLDMISQHLDIAQLCGTADDPGLIYDARTHASALRAITRLQQWCIHVPGPLNMPNATPRELEDARQEVYLVHLDFIFRAMLQFTTPTSRALIRKASFSFLNERDNEGLIWCARRNTANEMSSLQRRMQDLMPNVTELHLDIHHLRVNTPRWQPLARNAPSSLPFTIPAQVRVLSLSDATDAPAPKHCKTGCNLCLSIPSFVDGGHVTKLIIKDNHGSFLRRNGALAFLKNFKNVEELVLQCNNLVPLEPIIAQDLVPLRRLRILDLRLYIRRNATRTLHEHIPRLRILRVPLRHVVDVAYGSMDINPQCPWGTPETSIQPRMRPHIRDLQLEVLCDENEIHPEGVEEGALNFMKNVKRSIVELNGYLVSTQDRRRVYTVPYEAQTSDHWYWAYRATTARGEVVTSALERCSSHFDAWKNVRTVTEPPEDWKPTEEEVSGPSSGTAIV